MAEKTIKDPPKMPKTTPRMMGRLFFFFLQFWSSEEEREIDKELGCVLR